MQIFVIFNYWHQPLWFFFLFGQWVLKAGLLFWHHWNPSERRNTEVVFLHLYWLSVVVLSNKWKSNMSNALYPVCHYSNSCHIHVIFTVYCMWNDKIWFLVNSLLIAILIILYTCGNTVTVSYGYDRRRRKAVIKSVTHTEWSCSWTLTLTLACTVETDHFECMLK